jgi:hypothetical protein
MKDDDEEDPFMNRLLGSIANPRRSPMDYITDRYGLEVAAFLHHNGAASTRQLADDRTRSTVERQIKRMTLAWVLDYDREYLADRPVEKSLSLELRLLNMRLNLSLRDLGVSGQSLMEAFDHGMKRFTDPGADTGTAPDAPADDGIHYVERIEAALTQEIFLRFFTSSITAEPSLFSDAEQTWGRILQDCLEALVTKTIVTILHSGIASDEATDREIELAAVGVIEQAMTTLGYSSPSELESGGSEAFKTWLRNAP